MVSLKKFFAAMATTCALTVQAAPASISDKAVALPRDSPTASTEPTPHHLQKRFLQEMRLYWSDDGRVVVLSGAFMSVELMQALSQSGALGAPGQALMQGLRNWAHATSLYVPPNRVAAIAAIAAAQYQTLFWQRTSRHSEFGFTTLLNLNRRDLAQALDRINQWARQHRITLNIVHQVNGFADAALRNRYKIKKRGVSPSCAVSFNAMNLEGAPLDDAEPWGLFKVGDSCY